MTTEVGITYSVEDLLARSRAAAESRSSAGQSRVQQLLAGQDLSDRVELSPVARALQANQARNPQSQTPFTEQDWYINAKVAQLRGQLELYSTLPGLDPSGAVLQSLEDEIIGFVKKQQDKLKKSQAEAAEKQAELDRLEKERADAPMSADDMLKKTKAVVNGQAPETTLSKEVQALLDKSKGSVVNRTA